MTTIHETNSALLGLLDALKQRLGDLPPPTSLNLAHSLGVEAAQVYHLQAARRVAPAAPTYDHVRSALVAATQDMLDAGWAGCADFDPALKRGHAAVERFREALA